MIKYIITSEVQTGHTGRTKVGLERPQSRMVLALTVLSLRISTTEDPSTVQAPPLGAAHNSWQ